MYFHSWNILSEHSQEDRCLGLKWRVWICFSYLYYWKCYEWIFQNGAIKTKVDWLIQNLYLGNVFQGYLQEMHNRLWREVIYTDGQIYCDLVYLAMVVTNITKWPFLHSLLPVMLNQKMRTSELQTVIFPNCTFQRCI